MKVHHAHVAHHSPGRLRLKVPTAKMNAQVLHEIRLLMKNRKGVKDVSINPTTGSVLLHYDSTQWQNPEAEVRAVASVSGVFSIETECEEVKGVEEEAEFLAEHSDFARSVVDYVKQLNQNVKRMTNNAVDLNVLVPLGAAVYAFLELESDAATPLWLTLGIFSFNSFVSLHAKQHQAPPA